MHLFQDRLALKAFARSYARPMGSFFEAMALVRVLQHGRREGFLETMPETRIEQSFNERLFAELFGYRTLLRDGAGHYHLRPKHFHGSGRYDDFSLRFYGPAGGKALVSCELKSPLTDLDKPQTSGAYDLRQLLALFSKRTLLGDGLRASLLEHLYNGRLENVVPSTRGRIRLLQHVMPYNPDQPELPLYRLEDALRRDQPATLVDRFHGPDVVNDRLVFTQCSSSGEPNRVTEATKSGVLQSSEYIEEQGDGPTVTLSGQTLLERIMEFLRQAKAFYSALNLGEVDAAWHLEGIAGVTCRVEKEWVRCVQFIRSNLCR